MFKKHYKSEARSSNCPSHFILYFGSKHFPFFSQRLFPESLSLSSLEPFSCVEKNTIIQKTTQELAKLQNKLQTEW